MAGKSVTFRSAIKSGPTKDTQGWVELFQYESGLDPTVSTTATNMVLPKGAVVTDVLNMDGGATGGTTPTIDVGTSGDADAFANELDADGVAGALSGGTTGASYGTVLTQDETVYVGVGSSAATGGTVTVGVKYFVDGTQSKDPSYT